MNFAEALVALGSGKNVRKKRQDKKFFLHLDRDHNLEVSTGDSYTLSMRDAPEELEELVFPKLKKRYYIWSLKLNLTSGEWVKVDTYMDDSGESASGTSIFDLRQHPEAIKHKNEFIEV